MTAQTLRPVDSAVSSMCGHWLAPALEMAALASANWPLAPGPALQGWTRHPRVATRTPATDVRSVSAARDFTIATLRRWEVGERCDDIAIVVSELLTNALRHALPDPGETRPWQPIRLGLLQPGHGVLCAVADPSEQAPVPKEPGCLAESGRGLHVIGALSDRWGFTMPSDRGKVVWAMFSIPPGPPHAGTSPWPSR